MSDLAAKGAEPIGVLVGFVLGNDDAGVVAGLEEALAYYRAPLLAATRSLMGACRPWAFTAIGRATHRPYLRAPGQGRAIRFTSREQSGRQCWGWRHCAPERRQPRHRRPCALLAEGQALAPYVTAMMDVSDGLLLDAARMARASGVTLAIDRTAVPIAAPEDRRDDALRWGDDYQCCSRARRA
jgi:thiamine-monophosphate kinase